MNNLIKQNNIVLRNFLNITLLIIFSSCNNDSKEKTINSPSTKEDVSIDRQKLAERANDFYEKNKYSEAILSYDTLISIDSTKGGYYFKRAYCKSMLLNNDADAISDYYKAIERNYSKKQTAYLNIGVLYRDAANYNSALYFYNECLKIEPDNVKAIQETKEVNEILKKFK